MYLLCEWASKLNINFLVGLLRVYITLDLKLVWSEWPLVIVPANTQAYKYS